MSRTQVAQTLKVVFYPEPNGSGWNAEVPAVPGCLSCGRSLVEARRNIREALSLFDAGQGATLEESVRLPASMRAAVRRYDRACQLAAKAEARYRIEGKAAAAALTQKLGLRDAGELLGLSHQGVKNLTRG